MDYPYPFAEQLYKRSSQYAAGPSSSGYGGGAMAGGASGMGVQQQRDTAAAAMQQVDTAGEPIPDVMQPGHNKATPGNTPQINMAPQSHASHLIKMPGGHTLTGSRIGNFQPEGQGLFNKMSIDALLNLTKQALKTHGDYQGIDAFDSVSDKIGLPHRMDSEFDTRKWEQYRDNFGYNDQHQKKANIKAMVGRINNALRPGLAGRLGGRVREGLGLRGSSSNPLTAVPASSISKSTARGTGTAAPIKAKPKPENPYASPNPEPLTHNEWFHGRMKGQKDKYGFNTERGKYPGVFQRWKADMAELPWIAKEHGIGKAIGHAGMDTLAAGLNSPWPIASLFGGALGGGTYYDNRHSIGNWVNKQDHIPSWIKSLFPTGIEPEWGKGSPFPTGSRPGSPLAKQSYVSGFGGSSSVGSGGEGDTASFARLTSNLPGNTKKMEPAQKLLSEREGEDQAKAKVLNDFVPHGSATSTKLAFLGMNSALGNPLASGGATMPQPKPRQQRRALKQQRRQSRRATRQQNRMNRQQQRPAVPSNPFQGGWQQPAQRAPFNLQQRNMDPGIHMRSLPGQRNMDPGIHMRSLPGQRNMDPGIHMGQQPIDNRWQQQMEQIFGRGYQPSNPYGDPQPASPHSGGRAETMEVVYPHHNPLTGEFVPGKGYGGKTETTEVVYPHTNPLTGQFVPGKGQGSGWANYASGQMGGIGSMFGKRSDDMTPTMDDATPKPTANIGGQLGAQMPQPQQITQPQAVMGNNQVNPPTPTVQTPSEQKQQAWQGELNKLYAGMSGPNNPGSFPKFSLAPPAQEPNLLQDATPKPVPVLGPHSQEYTPHAMSEKMDLDKYALPRPPKMPALHASQNVKMSAIHGAIELGVEAALIELAETNT